nr:cystatin-B [Vulpes vulpes]
MALRTNKGAPGENSDTAVRSPRGREATNVLSGPQVKAQLEERENKKYTTFKAVTFRSQVVAGTNYFIKVQVDDDEFVHLRVFQSLPHENKPLALSSYQTNKAKHDELAYF